MTAVVCAAIDPVTSLVIGVVAPFTEAVTWTSILCRACVASVAAVTSSAVSL